MSSYILVTGGVVSGLGKGIAASSIGLLMKSAGYRVTMIKLDPYLQVDAGTMSPYEHGEVFVLDDGAETDLDFGHYQRFVGSHLSQTNSITTGKVYRDVISRERRGDYLGKTVQVIPHITDTIKDYIHRSSTDHDIVIVELGGTIGDIEGFHFIEAMRQLRHEVGRDNFLTVHLAPLIHLPFSGELKTKAIQHSVIKLREIGISPDIILCRTAHPLTPGLKDKIALFCDLDADCVLEARDESSIYDVPLGLHLQGIDELIQKKLFGSYRVPALDVRRERVTTIHHPQRHVTIGIAGKYTHFEDCYRSVIEALTHAGALLGTKIHIHRIDTADYEDEQRRDRLAQTISTHQIKAFLVPGGFGSRGVEGMIHVAQYAMTEKIPYLGLCLGLQVAVISYARYVLGLSRAHSTEFDEITPDPVVSLLQSQHDVTDKGGTMRLGQYPSVLQHGSRIADVYKQYGYQTLQPTADGVIYERHRHRYEVNPAYHQQLFEAQSGGIQLVMSGSSPDGTLVEHIEIADHPYYVATQAHPEFLSSLDHPHPMFVGLVESVIVQ